MHMSFLDNKEVGKRLADIREQKELSSRQFAMAANIDPSQYAKIEKGELPITTNICEKICNTYGVEQNYLLYGKNVPHETTKDSNYLSKRRELKNNTTKEIPMYGGFTTLGNIELIDDEKLKHKVVAQLPPEVFPGCDFAERAKGQSMYPYIQNQAVLVGKTCTMQGIVYGEIYTIKTKHGLDTTKYLHPSEKVGNIRLVAYNRNVPDQEILIDDVVFVYRVHFIINPT